MIRRSSTPRSLQDGLNTRFGLEYERHPELWRNFLDVSPSRKAYEEDVLLYGLGGAQLKPESRGVDYDEGGEAWVARYHHETFALAFAITEEAIEDQLYGDFAAKMSEALARSMQYTKEIKCHAVLNNGFSASYPGGDGVSLFSTSHPMVNGETLSNKLATPADLSETSLEAAVNQMAQWKDDRGIPIVCSITRAIVHPSEQFNIQRILDTPGRPGTGFTSQPNDINVLRKGNYVPDWASSVYLTDPDAWFLKTNVPDGLKHMTRIAIQRGMEGDFETGNARYKSRERYSNGWTNPRGAFASEGAG